MKNLFDPARTEEVKLRLDRLQPDSKPLWGTMNVAQAVAHCSAAFQMAAGEIRPPRAPIGRILGFLIKPLALRDDRPMRANSPTPKALLARDHRDLATERERLCTLIDQFAATGPQRCTTHPHSFFGRLTPGEWAILMYKHLDHHLRQFGA